MPLPSDILNASFNYYWLPLTREKTIQGNQEKSLEIIIAVAHDPFKASFYGSLISNLVRSKIEGEGKNLKLFEARAHVCFKNEPNYTEYVKRAKDFFKEALVTIENVAEENNIEKEKINVHLVSDANLGQSDQGVFSKEIFINFLKETHNALKCPVNFFGFSAVDNKNKIQALLKGHEALQELMKELGNAGQSKFIYNSPGEFARHIKQMINSADKLLFPQNSTFPYSNFNRVSPRKEEPLQYRAEQLSGDECSVRSLSELVMSISDLDDPQNEKNAQNKKNVQNDKVENSSFENWFFNEKLKQTLGDKISLDTLSYHASLGDIKNDDNNEKVEIVLNEKAEEGKKNTESNSNVRPFLNRKMTTEYNIGLFDESSTKFKSERNNSVGVRNPSEEPNSSIFKFAK